MPDTSLNIPTKVFNYIAGLTIIPMARRPGRSNREFRIRDCFPRMADKN
jgi:hypothetical protein